MDPVPEILRVCRAHGLWLHVDGAYGGVAGLVPELRHLLDGVDGADSLVVNPHKWMFVPIDCSVLYTRRPDLLKRAFSLVPEYLDDDLLVYCDSTYVINSVTKWMAGWKRRGWRKGDGKPVMVWGTAPGP